MKIPILIKPKCPVCQENLVQKIQVKFSLMLYEDAEILLLIYLQIMQVSVHCTRNNNEKINVLKSISIETIST